MIMPASSSLISFQTSEKEQGKMLGLMQSVGSLARGIGPLFGGALYGVSHLAPYVGGFVIMTGCGYLAIRMAKKLIEKLATQV
jgi:MFS family permease